MVLSLVLYIYVLCCSVVEHIVEIRHNNVQSGGSEHPF